MPIETARQKYYDACLQTNVPAGLRALRGNASPFAKRVLRRFVHNTEKTRRVSDDALVSEAVILYRKYYRNALLQKKNREILEQELLRNLHSLLSELKVKRKAKSDWAQTEQTLRSELRRRGYFSLVGKVAPFRCLMIWEEEKERIFTVPLTTHRQKVKVVLLDRFLELGWMHFATFGKYYVGGWARKDALYCVAQAYKRDFRSERFLVSYLNHEAQHLADLRKFPKIKSHELEYRAKLAELAASRAPGKLARRFFAEASDDPALPHCYAAFLLKQGLGQERSAVGIRKKAVRLLEESSLALRVDQPKG